jgi:HEAT repeat protein/nucleoside phosphorylase
LEDYSEIQLMINSNNTKKREWATRKINSNFSILKNKEQAWKDLLALTKDKKRKVRWGAVDALGAAFQYLTDKEQAWKDLLALTKDEDRYVRRRAADALGSAFQYLTNKDQAWKDLLALTKDKNSDVRRCATDALGSAFQHLTDKEQAWKDLLALTKDQDSDMRRRTTYALGSAFQYLPDKEQASKDLLSLTKDQDRGVRRRAADALGSAFQYLTDKEQAWKDLLALTKDENSYVRVSANHSLGKISVYRATNAKYEGLVQKELENAISFFEKSVQESTLFNPAKFCLPFYRSYYSVIFKKQEAKEEVKKNLDEAKRAVSGSESKEKLLEAVENLSNALNEAQKLQELDDIKADLNGYRRYCDRACELLDSTEDRAPGATLLVRRGLPVIDERIQRTIEEIQEKSKALCKKTRNAESPLEPLGIEINQYAGELSTKDYLKSERTVPRITRVLGNYCKHLPEEKRGYACELIEEINDEEELSDKLNKIELVLTYLEPQIEIEMKSSNHQFNALQQQPTIGIITALPKEFTAMKILLVNTASFKVPGQGAGRRYCLGKIPSNDGENHSVVLAFAGMGNNIAALRASLLLEHFPNVTSIIMTGIAGGVPHKGKSDEHVRLGDIVVSDHRGVIQYDFISDEITEKEHRLPPRPPSASLLESVRLLQASEIEGNRPWLKYIDRGIDKHRFSSAVYVPPKNPSFSHQNLWTNNVFSENVTQKYVPFMEH